MNQPVDLDVVEAADVTALSIEEQAAAFFKGTASIHALVEDFVCPVIRGQIGKSDYEQAVADVILTDSRCCNSRPLIRANNIGSKNPSMGRVIQLLFCGGRLLAAVLAKLPF